ncbi:hypothetical protein AVL56_19105 [Alteromonas stellipolaris]|uniref:hypothetical protein n=1 Tax=Alteromonas stellipolaris TaxID=233316 RepID=UPI00076FE0AB|nr:hypothetical protein [Alteromonas stellipolaris]AMJ96214.1 hypothetical protein AVL56_19105 [Alteromonas stellipolaris]
MLKRNVIILFTLMMSFSSSAALVKFSFEGKVTDIDNIVGSFWDSSVIGAKISGYMIMDTERAIGGREETSYYWWNNIDSDPGALTTFFEILGKSYILSGDYDYNAMYDSYVTDEFLEYGGGIDEYGDAVPDNFGLKDTEQHETIVNGDETFINKKFAFGISDSLIDFLTDFRPVPGVGEPQPDWLQEILWVNDGTIDNGKSGGGSFDYYETFDDGVTDRETVADAMLYFRLSQVSTQQVSSVSTPNSFTLFIIAAVMLVFRFRLR